MKVRISYVGITDTVEQKVKDVGMMNGGVVLKVSDDVDMLIPFDNVECIEIDKETRGLTIVGGKK